MAQVLVAKSVRSRNTVIYWWGICSYSRLKVTYEVRAMLCPHCGHELTDGVYSGSTGFVKDRNARGYVRDRWLPLKENGVVVWRAVSGDVKRCKSGFVYVSSVTGKIVSRSS